jgi:hypothetical protein
MRGWQVDLSNMTNDIGEGSWFLPNQVIASYVVGTKTLTIDFTHDNGIAISGVSDGTQLLLTPGTVVRLAFQSSDRVLVRDVTGQVVDTFNYYGGDFFQLPIVRIQKVELLNPETLQPTREASWALRVRTAGLRYSHLEENQLEILDTDADYLPFRVTYLTDPTIESVHAYITDDQRRLLAADVVAKRMETFSVDLTLTVASGNSVQTLSAMLASYINTLASTVRLTIDGIVKSLYEQQAETSIDMDSVILGGTYYKQDGTEEIFTNATELFGGSTAAYLARTVSVTKRTY